MSGSPHAGTASEVEATSFDVASDDESALDEMESKELGSAIERAIARLRPEYRSCILLRHVEGRSYEEIAATLDLPLGTVKTYIHRARHRTEALESPKTAALPGPSDSPEHRPKPKSSETGPPTPAYGNRERQAIRFCLCCPPRPGYR